MKGQSALRTPEQARKWLDEHGVTIAEFARRVNLPRWAVVDALRGRTKGRWGASHQAAVKLGIKPRPKGEPPFSLESTHAADAA
jgi:gp16 family phage-associated protein